MITTQRIKSTTATPVKFENYEAINVLKWNNSKWKIFSPYYLKTDGQESTGTPAGIVFENYWQGSKVYDVVFDIKAYPSKFQEGNDKYLLWSFESVDPKGDQLFKDGVINYELYYRWRDSLWGCKNAIRYPNGIHRRHRTQFVLYKDERLGYLESRIRIYFTEYIRLIKTTQEYQKLLQKLRNGENLMICEIDVPAKGKKGHYGDCLDNDICHMTIEKINLLLNDTSEAFGHGLCLAYALLTDK